MHPNILISFLIFLCVFNRIAKSSAIDLEEITETEDDSRNETQVLETSTFTSISLSSSNASNPPESTEVFTVPDITSTTDPPTTEKAEVTSKSTLHETSTETMARPRRQDHLRRLVPKNRVEPPSLMKYSPSSTLFDMCPPLEITCPVCSVPQNQLSHYICYYPVVLKVLVLSPSETDSSGRMCGKLGKLAAHGTTGSKQFRSLLRFSVKDTCGCQLKVSQHYFLLTQISEFKKQGRVYSKISLSEQSLLVPVDQYMETDILNELASCSSEQRIGRIPNAEEPQQSLYTDSHPPYTDSHPPPDFQSVPHDPSHQQVISSDSTQRVSARSARGPYEQMPPANYLPPSQPNLYFPPLLQPSPALYPPAQVSVGTYPNFIPMPPMKFPPMMPNTQRQIPQISQIPQMTPFRPYPTQNQPHNVQNVLPPNFYVPPLVYNQPQSGVHKSISYSATNQGHQVNVHANVQYQSTPQPNPTESKAHIPNNTPPNYVPNVPMVPPQYIQNSAQQYTNSSSSFSSSLSSSASGQPGQSYIPALSNCLYLPSTCPCCFPYNETGFREAYCNSKYAFLSTITFPDHPSRQTATGIAQGNDPCLIVRAQLLHDISKTTGQHNLYQSVSLLLPSYCKCFEDIKHPVIVLLLGFDDKQPTPPQTQFNQHHDLFLLPAPSDTTLPHCPSYQAPTVHEEVKSNSLYHPHVRYASENYPVSPPPPPIQYPATVPIPAPEIQEYPSLMPPIAVEHNAAQDYSVPIHEPTPSSNSLTPHHEHAVYQESTSSPTTSHQTYEAVTYPPPPQKPLYQTENYPSPLQSFEEANYILPPQQQLKEAVTYPSPPPQPYQAENYPTPPKPKPYQAENYPSPLQQQLNEAVTYPSPPPQPYQAENYPTPPIPKPYQVENYPPPPKPQVYQAENNLSPPQPQVYQAENYPPPPEPQVYQAENYPPPPPRPQSHQDENYPSSSKPQVYVAGNNPSPLQPQSYETAQLPAPQTYIQEYEAGVCPSNVVQSCPLPYVKYDASQVSHYCAAPFAIIVELEGPGLQRPYYTFPRISIKTTSSAAERTVVVSVSALPPLSCSQISVKVIKSIGNQQAKFQEGSTIPIVLVSNCNFYFARRNKLNRLLLYSSTIPNYLPNGGIQITEHIHIVSLEPHQPPPSCIVSRPIYISPSGYPGYQPGYPPSPTPPTYLPVSPQYRPAHEIAPSPPITNEQSHYVLQPSEIPPPVNIPSPSYINTPPPIVHKPFDYEQYPSNPEIKPLEYKPPLIYKNAISISPPVVYRPAEYPPALEYTPPPIYKTPYVPPVPMNRQVDYTPPSEYRPQVHRQTPPPYAYPQRPTQPPASVSPNPYAYTASQKSSVTTCPKPEQPPSCPTFKEALPFDFHKMYCMSNFAMVVATGVDKDARYITEKGRPIVIPFLKSKRSKLDLKYDDSTYSYNLTVTRDKTGQRLINNAAYGSFRRPAICHNEKVLGLYDVAKERTAHEYLVDLDLYVPITCDTSVFDISPAYGILLSTNQPDLSGPIQMSNQFAFFPLAEGQLTLPICIYPPPTPSYDEAPFKVTQFVPPALNAPRMEVSCTNNSCGACSFAKRGTGFSVPCDMRFAAVVEILETSAELNIAPSLEIHHHLSKEHFIGTIIHVKSHSPDQRFEKPPAYQSNPATHYSDNVKCKYAKVRVVQDLSPYSTYPTRDKELTLVIPVNCNCHLFDVDSGFAILLTKFPVLSNYVVPITGDFSTVACLPYGLVTISICPTATHANWLYNTPNSENPTNQQFSYSFSYAQTPGQNHHVPNQYNPYTQPPSAPYAPPPAPYQPALTGYLPPSVQYTHNPDQYAPIPATQSQISVTYAPEPIPEQYASTAPPYIPATDPYAPKVEPYVPLVYNPNPYVPRAEPNTPEPVLEPYLSTPEPYILQRVSYEPVPPPHVPAQEQYVHPSPESYYTSPTPYKTAPDQYITTQAQYATGVPYTHEQTSYTSESYPIPQVPDVSKSTSELYPDPYAEKSYEGSAHVYEHAGTPNPYVQGNFSIGAVPVYPVSVPEHPICTDHKKAALQDCPVCEEIRCIKPEVYCNSKLAVIARPSGKYKAEIEQSSGNIISLYEISSHKPAQRAVSKIMYQLPKHCSCPMLKENRFVVVLIEDAVPLMSPVMVHLDEGDYVYSTFSGKVTLPACTSDQPRTGNMPEEIVLPPVPDSELPDALQPSLCPDMDHSCPKCESVDDDKLKNLVCASDNAIVVSLDDASLNGSTNLGGREQITVTQHIAQNYSIGIEIKPHEYENRCILPEQPGDCNSVITRFHYDSSEEVCYAFDYSGCNGNANNFKTEEECEETCMKNDNCDKGNLHIHKIVRGSSENQHETFQYVLPEQCNCPQLKTGEIGYLLFNTSSSEVKIPTQFSQNYHLIKLSDAQRNIEIVCDKDSSETNFETDTYNLTDTVQNVSEATIEETPTTTKKTKRWFG